MEDKINVYSCYWEIFCIFILLLYWVKIVLTLNAEGRCHNLSIVVDARDESVEIEQVEGGAESVTQCSQSRCLQVLQLAHECGMVLFPTRLPYTGNTQRWCEKQLRISLWHLYTEPKMYTIIQKVWLDLWRKTPMHTKHLFDQNYRKTCDVKAEFPASLLQASF